MKLDNQLYVREKSTQRGRMCGNVVEICQFIYELLQYQLTALEYQTLDDFLRAVLPLRDFAPYEKRKILLVSDTEGKVYELNYREIDTRFQDRVPEGHRVMGQVFSSAYTRKSGSVARFDFGTEAHPVTINLTRKDSEQPQKFSSAEELWMQQVAHFDNPSVPNVKADLSPLRADQQPKTDSDLFELRCGEKSFTIYNSGYMRAALRDLLHEEISPDLEEFIDTSFHHLQHFPKGKAFAMPMPYFKNQDGSVYVGQEANHSGRRYLHCGMLYPAFFTGGIDKVLSLKTGCFQDTMATVLLLRVDDK